MDRGWTKSWRKRWDSDLAAYPYANHIFQYLIDKAAYKKTTTSFRYQCVQLEKGDVLIGRDSLSANTGVSRRSVRTCLNYLKSTNRIAIRTTNRYSIVSILKWDTYQGDDTATDQQNGQQTDQQATSKRPASDHIEEVKKLKKDQNLAAVAIYEFYSENIIRRPDKRSDAIHNITKLLNNGCTKEDLAGAVEDYLEKGIGDKPFHPNNFFGQKEYYKGFGKFAKEPLCLTTSP